VHRLDKGKEACIASAGKKTSRKTARIMAERQFLTAVFAQSRFGCLLNQALHRFGKAGITKGLADQLRGSLIGQLDYRITGRDQVPAAVELKRNVCHHQFTLFGVLHALERIMRLREYRPRKKGISTVFKRKAIVCSLLKSYEPILSFRIHYAKTQQRIGCNSNYGEEHAKTCVDLFMSLKNNSVDATGITLYIFRMFFFE
jgi:hypothetical protein